MFWSKQSKLIALSAFLVSGAAHSATITQNQGFQSQSVNSFASANFTCLSGSIFPVSDCGSATIDNGEGPETGTGIDDTFQATFDVVPLSSINKFDPTLGTLTGVEVAVTGDFSDFDATLVAESNGFEIGNTGIIISIPGISASVDLSATIVPSFPINENDSTTPFAELFSLSCRSLVTPDCEDELVVADDAVIAGSQTFVVDSGALNRFIGTGTVADEDLSFDLVADLTAIALTLTGQGVAVDVELPESMELAGEMIITYTYTPGAVIPIPAAAWLFLSAMGGLVSFKRYKSSK